MLKAWISIVLFVSVATSALAESSAAKPNFVLVAQDLHLETKQTRTAYYVDFSSIGPDKEEPRYISMKVATRYLLDPQDFRGKKLLSEILINLYDCSNNRSKAIEVEQYSTDFPSPSSVIYKSVRPTAQNGGFMDLWNEPPQSVPFQTLHSIACGKLKRKDFK